MTVLICTAPDAEAVLEAAVAWWEGYRPKGWTAAEHRRNPTVNCPTSRAAELAEAVAALGQKKNGRTTEGLDG